MFVEVLSRSVSVRAFLWNVHTLPLYLKSDQKSSLIVLSGEPTCAFSPVTSFLFNSCLWTVLRFRTFFSSFALSLLGRPNTLGCIKIIIKKTQLLFSTIPNGKKINNTYSQIEILVFKNPLNLQRRKSF